MNITHKFKIPEQFILAAEAKGLSGKQIEEAYKCYINDRMELMYNEFTVEEEVEEYFKKLDTGIIDDIIESTQP